jgi:hypothetical protein
MFRHAYPVPLERHPSAARLAPVTTTGGSYLRAARSGARVTVARPNRSKGGSAPRRTCSIKTGKAATVVVVEDDLSVLRALSRLIKAAGFRVLRPAKRVARERNSESQRVYGGRYESSRDEWKRIVQRLGSIGARPACHIDHWSKRPCDTTPHRESAGCCVSVQAGRRGRPIRRYRSRTRSF